MPVLMAVRLGAIPVEIVLVRVMRVMNVRMGVFERLMRVLMLVMLGCSQTPIPIREAATQNGAGVDSPNSRMAMAAPTKGAVEK